MMPEAAALALLASLLAAPAVSMSAADQKVAALDSRIHSASAADERAIGDFLRYALAEEAAMAKIEKAIRAADGPVPRPDFQKRLDAAQMPYRNRRDEMMQFAINKALTAYGMFAPDASGAPVMPKGEVVDPRLHQYGVRGETTWKVFFSKPPPAVRRIAEGKLTWRGRLKELTTTLSADEIAKYDGNTVGDGVTVIWPDLENPNRNPPKLTAPALARLLHHELVHFYIQTTPGDGESVGQAREEVKALTSDLGILKSLNFSPAELSGIEGFLKDRQRKVQTQILSDDTTRKFNAFSSRLRGLLTGNRADEAVIESSIPGLYFSPEEMGELRRRADTINERVAAARTSREESARHDGVASGHPSSGGPYGDCAPSPGLPAPCGPKVSPPILSATPGRIGPAPGHAEAIASPPPAQALPAFDAWSELSGLAARGCSNPSSVTDEELQRLWPRLERAPAAEAQARKMGLSGCQLALFLKLASAKDRTELRAAEFAALAEEARDDAARAIPIDDGHPQDKPNTPRCRYMGSWCDGSGD